MEENKSKQSRELRKLAEDLIQKQVEGVQYLPAGDVHKLIHELEVHQIELEIQNEELRSAQLQLEESRNKYYDLFDFAPIAYFSLGEGAEILAANLSGAEMLGVPRRDLINRAFSGFVAPEERGLFYSHRKRTLDTRTRQSRDLKLVKADGTVVCAQLESIAVPGPEGDFAQLRTTITDITELKQAEEALRESSRLNELLLDTLPHPAMLISKDRIILAANRMAREVGGEPGGLCWRDFGKGEYIPDCDKQYLAEHQGSIPPGGSKCTFCLADQVFEEGKQQYNPRVEAFGELWDTWWIPIDDDTYLHYAVKITERTIMEDALRYRLDFEKLISDISTRFISIPPENVDQGIERALETIGRFANADGGYVYVFSRDMERCSMTHLWRNEHLTTTKQDLQDLNVASMPWWFSKLRDNEPVVVPSLAELPAEAADEKCIIEPQGVRSLVDVPMVYLGKVIGFLGFGCAMRQRHWTDDEISLLEMVGQMITNALKRREINEALQQAHDQLERRVEERTADLVAANEKMEQEILERRRAEKNLKNLSSQLLDAHESESKRIGQELHDGLAQSLSAIKLWVEAALLNIKEDDPAEAAKSVESIVSLSQGAIEEVRRIIRNLRPSILDDLGVLVAVSSLCQDFAKTHPEIRVAEEITLEESEVPEFLKIVIYRIAQEALNNIAKHSQANRVDLSLISVEDKIELTIHDNGLGFDMGKGGFGENYPAGLGLGSMRERTEYSGGTFSIESHRGAGTTIQAKWES